MTLDGSPPRPSVLEADVRAGLARDLAPWPQWIWAAPLAGLVALIVTGQLLARVIQFHGQAAVLTSAGTSILGDLILSVILWVCARDAARREGGWGETFGIAAPAQADLLPWLAGFAAVFIGRLVVIRVANSLSADRASKQASNLRLHDVHGVGLDLLIIAVVVVAPLVEEALFRGVLLRAFMQHMPFWPACALSTVLFAGFHVYEVNTVLGAVTLAASVAVLGLTNCILVRLTGRLTPGILTHASFNFVAVLILAASKS